MAISSRTLKSPGFIIAALSIVSLGIVGFGLYLMLQPSSSSAPAEEAAPEEVVEERKITALGRIEPAGGIYSVAAPSTQSASRVMRIQVQEGQQVAKGDTLAFMDSHKRLIAAVLQAEAQAIEAQANLEQVKAGAKTGDIQAEVAAAEASQANIRSQAAEVDARSASAAVIEAELRKAQLDLERHQKLFEDGAISESDFEARQLTFITRQRQFDEARLQLEGARSELEAIVKRFEQAKQQVAGLREVRPEDIQRAEAGIQAALANLNRTKAELEQSVVLAPIDGQILEIHASNGEAVGEEGILDLARTDRMTVVAEIYETDIRDVKVGQPVKVTSPALATSLPGRVVQVGLKIDKTDVLDTDPAADTDARVVEVTVLLENSEPVANLTNLQVNVAIDTAAPILQSRPSPNPPTAVPGGLQGQPSQPRGGLLNNGLLDSPLLNDTGNEAADNIRENDSESSGGSEL